MKQYEHIDYVIRAEEILNSSMSFNEMKNMVYYIVNQIEKNEKVIEKLKEKGKDTSNLEYERDSAKFVLGLIPKPDIRDYKFWQDMHRKDD
jgi:hypothetical protein